MEDKNNITITVEKEVALVLFDFISELEKIDLDEMVSIDTGERSALSKLLGKTTLEKNPDVSGRVKRMIMGNTKEGVQDSLLAMAGRSDSSSILKLIQCPTLVLAGDEDAFIPAEETRSMQQGISGAKLDIIKNAGHLINLEQPEPFHQALETFFDEYNLG